MFLFTREDRRRGGGAPCALSMGLATEHVAGMWDRCVFIWGRGDIVMDCDIVGHMQEEVCD